MNGNLILYRKAIKDGDIKESDVNGQNVWFIKPNSSVEIKPMKLS